MASKQDAELHNWRVNCSCHNYFLQLPVTVATKTRPKAQSGVMEKQAPPVRPTSLALNNSHSWDSGPPQYIVIYHLIYRSSFLMSLKTDGCIATSSCPKIWPDWSSFSKLINQCLHGFLILRRTFASRHTWEYTTSFPLVVILSNILLNIQ